MLARKKSTAAMELLPLLDSAPVPLALVIDDAVEGANRRAEELFGGNLQGVALGELLPAEDHARFVQQMRRGFARMELKPRRRDGTPFWAVVAGQPAGEGLMLAFQETTSQKLREEELRDVQSEAAQDLKARMRFFAGASHDLRQPLQAMALFLSALEKHVPPQASTIFQSLRVSLQTMEDMFESLLGLARLDAGILKPAPSVFMVGDVLEKVEADSAAQAEVAGIRVRYMPSAEAVRSDAAMLARILRAFVSNAIRHNEKGGKVLVGCRKRGAWLRIEVWDNGAGLGEERLADLSDAFYQNRIGEKEKGSGLGLALVQRLAQSLDHRVEVRSVKERGSVFAVEVPLAEA